MATNLLRYPINSIELSPTSSIVGQCQHIFSSNFFSRVNVIFPSALEIMSMTVRGFKCPSSHEGNPDIYTKSPTYDLYVLEHFTTENWYVWPRLLHPWQNVCFPVLYTTISIPATRAPQAVLGHNFPRSSFFVIDS